MSSRTRSPSLCATVAALLAGMTATVSAQPLPPEGAALDMQASVDRAVRWHPLMRHAQGQLLQAGEGIEAARAGYYPRISAGVNSRTGNSPSSGYDSRHVHRAEISLQQTLYDFGKVSSEVGRAEASTDVARASVLLSLDDVVRSTAHAWIEVRRYQELTRVAEEQVAAVKALAQLAQKREAEGAAARSDTVQAKARIEAAEVSLLTAQSQATRWRTTLMHWVGTTALPEVTGKPLAGLEQACGLPDALNTQPAAGPDGSAAPAVQLAEARLAVARAEADVAKSQERPTVYVDASVGRGLNSGSRRAGEPGADMSVMLNFSAPLYQGGRLQAGTRGAEYAIQAAQAALQQTRLTTAQELQDAVLAWRENSSRITLQAAREASMLTTRKLYRDQYIQLGTRSLLDLLNAEQEYHGTRSDQIDSEYNMYRSGVDCLYHSGELSPTFNVVDVAAHVLGALPNRERR